MGHSRAEKTATHQKIVEIAAKRFREVGLSGIGVAEVMKEAGLTVGGFYKHFASRDDLVVEALTEAFKDFDGSELKPECATHFVSSYLSEDHRDDPGCGCALGALAADVGRSSPAAREILTERVEMNFAFFAKLLGGEAAPEERARAIMIFSACVGGIELARAVSDPALSSEILRATADQLSDVIARSTAGGTATS